MDRRHAMGLMGAAAAGLSGARGEAAEGGHGAAEGPAGGGHPRPEFHLTVCAFHIAKKDPGLQVEAIHYCSPVAEEVHQCVIYDSRGKNAKLIGVEYIISDRIYRGLPEAEKKYYHPHAYEITAGLLIAPELKPEDEDGLMAKLANTWGKTWHTWPDPKTPLPMGDPLLMWSYTRDGMISDEVLGKRDREYRVSTAALRKRRSRIGPVPNIPPPRSLDEIGRQWTADGPDEPPKAE